MWASRTRYYLLAACLAAGLLACKDVQKERVYELQDVTVQQATAGKQNLKNDVEFLSVVYSDLFGRPITTEQINTLSTLYLSIGDRNMVIDMVIRDFLNEADVQIPAASVMRGDPAKFIEDTYKKFFVRRPTEYEKWYWVELIRKNETLKPDMVYYSFLTSKEYKYY